MKLDRTDLHQANQPVEIIHPQARAFAALSLLNLELMRATLRHAYILSGAVPARYVGPACPRRRGASL